MAAKTTSKGARPRGKTTRKAAATKAPAAKKAPATKKRPAPKKRAMAAERTGGSTTSTAPAASTGAPDATTAPRDAAYPIFYRAPYPLSNERHARRTIRREANYAFAARANSVPLNAAEFPLAARHYPILFSAGDPAVGIALLGLRDHQNLFVDAAGNWEAGVYIPAYIRRYPFIFMAGGEDGRYILCLDEDADALTESADGRPLFVNGEPTDVTNRALEFCKAYQQQSDYTRQLGTLLAKHGLLTANRANVSLQSGEKLALGGFRMIDVKALDALGDAAFLELRRAGALAIIYAQIFSTTNWASLASRDAARG